MASRDVYFVNTRDNLKKKSVNFKWYPGFAKAQKQKSISSLHKNFKSLYSESFSERYIKILEVSSASRSTLGNEASAFNLHVKTTHGVYTVEQLFQAGKIYENNGSLEGSLNLKSKQAKRRSYKVNKNDTLVGFGLFGAKFPLTPKTFFYDWIYLHGLIQNTDIFKRLLKYNAFTDIYANPKYTINSQAKSCAIFIMLYKKFGLKKLIKILHMNNKNMFRKIIYS